MACKVLSEEPCAFHWLPWEWCWGLGWGPCAWLSLFIQMFKGHSSASLSWILNITCGSRGFIWRNSATITVLWTTFRDHYLKKCFFPTPASLVARRMMNQVTGHHCWAWQASVFTLNNINTLSLTWFHFTCLYIQISTLVSYPNVNSNKDFI